MDRSTDAEDKNNGWQKNWLVKMTRGLVFCFVLLIVAAKSGIAQMDVHTLENAVNGKSLPLRSYCADAVCRYRLDGDHVETTATIHALTLFTAKSVSLVGTSVLIEGAREILIRDGLQVKAAAGGREPMRLEIELGGAALGANASKLIEMLFFADQDAAIANLPIQIAQVLPYNIGHSNNKEDHQAWIFDEGHWIQVDRGGKDFTLPAAVKTPAPKFSKDAKAARVGGKVFVVLNCLVTGRVDDLWLANPVGLGLDEKAIEAVAKYVLKPARYQGRDVAMEMAVQVEFRVF